MSPIGRFARAIIPCCVLVVVISPPAHGQGGRRIRGTVVSESDGKPVADAVIKVIEPSSSRFTYSSAAGRYELRVPDGEARLLVVRIG